MEVSKVRSKEITLKTMKMSTRCNIDSDWKRKIAMTAVKIAMENLKFNVDNKTGESLPVKLISKGWDLNYPRTIRMVFHLPTMSIVPEMGLSGTYYDISDGEYDFVRNLIRIWNDIQDMINGATFIVEGYYATLLVLKDRPVVWSSDFIEDKAKIISSLCQFLDKPLVSLINELETGMRILK